MIVAATIRLAYLNRAVRHGRYELAPQPEPRRSTRAAQSKCRHTAEYDPTYSADRMGGASVCHTGRALNTTTSSLSATAAGRPPSESDAVRQTFDGLRGGPLRPS
jgi:hypothetical protein